VPVSNHRVALIRLFGVLAWTGIVFASILLPAGWERLRTGHPRETLRTLLLHQENRSTQREPVKLEVVPLSVAA
jgi:hypothetical protein